MLQYREIDIEELNRELFAVFIRHQVVTKCRRKENDKWIIKDAPFIDDWSDAEYDFLVACLKKYNWYWRLCIWSLLEWRIKGLCFGRELFLAAKKWAKEHGAQKLYISAHSAVETQDF